MKYLYSFVLLVESSRIIILASSVFLYNKLQKKGRRRYFICQPAAQVSGKPNVKDNSAALTVLLEEAALPSAETT